VIPEPASKSRVVLRKPNKGPYFNSNQNDSYICGKCDFILARNVSKDYLQTLIHTEGGEGLVLQCPDCKSFNELGAIVGAI
jgi:phage FluMu protein Com